MGVNPLKTSRNQRAIGVMLKVRQSYRAHSARGLWQAVSLLTERVSQADIPTMELCAGHQGYCRGCRGPEDLGRGSVARGQVRWGYL